MQSQKIPVNSKVQNTDFSNKDNSSISFPSDAKKTRYIKLLGLLISLSSIGMVFSSHRPVQAKTLELGNKEKGFVSKPLALGVKTSQKTSLSLDLESETILPQKQTIETVLELPSLKVARVSKIKTVKKIHTIKSGETISSIAREYGISSSQIIAANQLINPHLIKIDSQLVIPQTKIASENNSSKIKTVGQSFPEDRKSLANGEIIISDATTPASFSSLVEKKAESREKKVNTEISIDKSPDDKNSLVNAENNPNPYINKLREDIVKLRTKYQQQSGDSEELTAASTVTIPTEKAVEATPKQIPTVEELEQKSNSDIEKAISPNSVPVENFNSLVSFSKTNSDIPNLPPLSSPEEYLPDNPVFNGYIWPAKGTLTSGYGWRWGRMHKGIDIAAPVGTPIMAAASGEVIFAGWNSGGYGNLVKLRHHDGSTTFYAHNHRVLVSNGQIVRQGQLIAEMGSTGRSTGPHLHFEIRPNGSTAINPIARLPRNSK